MADSPYCVGYDLDGQQIGLVPNGHDSQNMTGTTAFWHVDDIEASVKAVLDADRQRGDSSSAAPAVAISP
jgi:hypothetical protein